MTEIKKSNLLQLARIYSQGVLLTGFYCSRVYLAAVMKKGNRAYFDDQIHRWAKGLVRLIKLKFSVDNPYEVQLIPGKSTIIMCNHSSLYDIPVTFEAMPGSIRMLTKRELFRIPIFGIGMKAAEFISIDRHNREQAIRDLALARKRMESGIALWIAPEGTRSTSGELMPFKKGGFRLAIETNAQIIPVGIKGIHQVLPKNSMRIMFNVPVEFNIGKPIDASCYTMAQRDQLMADVRQSMLTLISDDQ